MGAGPSSAVAERKHNMKVQRSPKAHWRRCCRNCTGISAVHCDKNCAAACSDYLAARGWLEHMRAEAQNENSVAALS